MSNENTEYPMSFFDGLALVFIALKLSNHIDWSWWWIMSPIWSVVLVRLFVLALKKQKGEL